MKKDSEILKWGLVLLFGFLFVVGANYEEAPKTSTPPITTTQDNNGNEALLYHCVKPGETLTSIARYYRNNWGYNITAADIAAANPWLKDPNRIEAGWYLLIPSK